MLIVRDGSVFSWRGREFTGPLKSYTLGQQPSNYPVPAVVEQMTVFSHRWYSNDDGFWNANNDIVRLQVAGDIRQFLGLD